MVDQVSDTMRIPWSEVFKMQVLEFLNVNCYIRDKNNYEKEQMEKWRRTH